VTRTARDAAMDASVPPTTFHCFVISISLVRCGAGLPSGFKLNASSSTCVVLTTGPGAHDVNYREA